MDFNWIKSAFDSFLLEYSERSEHSEVLTSNF